MWILENVCGQLYLQYLLTYFDQMHNNPRDSSQHVGKRNYVLKLEN